MPTLPPCCTPFHEAALPERMYCAYNAAGDPATAGLNYQGKPCPTWAELPENIRLKWEGAARAVSPAQLSFGGAMDALHAGLRVRRPGGPIVEMFRAVGGPGRVLRAETEDGWGAWESTDDDLVAMDWEVVWP